MLSFTRNALNLTKRLGLAARAKSELNKCAALSTSIKSYVEVMFYIQMFPNCIHILIKFGNISI